MASKLTIILLVCALSTSYSISAVTMHMKHLDRQDDNNGGTDENDDDGDTGGSDDDIVSMGGEDEEVGHDNITAGLHSQKVTLNTTLPNTTGKVNTYKINNPKMTEEAAKATLLKRYPDWQKFSTNLSTFQSSRGNNVSSWRFNNENSPEQVTIDEMGGMMYYNHDVESKWNKILFSNDSYSTVTREQAYNISVEYINTHGFFPNGSFLFQNSSAIISSQSMPPTIDSYHFVFQRRFNDTLVAGRMGMGDGIMIWVTPLGDVHLMKMLWREIGEVNRTLSIKSASDAMDFVYEHLKTNQTIEKVELGYFIKNNMEPQYEMKPCWIFYTDSKFTQYYTVNALRIGWCY